MKIRTLITCVALLISGLASAQSQKYKLNLITEVFSIGSTKIVGINTPLIFDHKDELFPMQIKNLVGINCKTNRVMNFGSLSLPLDDSDLVEGTFEYHINEKHLKSFLKPLCKEKPRVYEKQLHLSAITETSFYTFYPDTFKPASKENYSVWVRIREYERDVLRDPDGKPFIGSATNQTYEILVPKEKSKESKIKYLFNCKDLTLTSTAFVDYDSSGKISGSKEYDESTLKDAVPGSIGLSVIKKLCMLV